MNLLYKTLISPDIVNLISGHDHVSDYVYPASFEDFTKDDSSYLDQWVMDRFENFIKNSTGDENMGKSRIIFFLHLLGSDTNGHVHKPHSKQYMGNVNVVDRITQKVEKLMKERFPVIS